MTLRGLAEADFVDLSVYLIEGAESPSGGFFGLYERIDRLVFGARGDALSEADELPAGLAASRSDDPDRLRDASLDVLLLLGPGSLEDALRGTAREGVWVLRFGSAQLSSDAPLFGEVYATSEVVEVSLVALGEAPAGDRVIYRSCLPAEPVSLHRLRARAYGAASRFPLACLTQLSRRGLAGLETRARSSAGPPAGPTAAHGPPSLPMVVSHMLRVCARAIRAVLRRRFVREDWLLGIRPHRGAASGSLDGLRVLSAPPARFLADPFLVESGGRHWLYFEDCPHAGGHGSISVAEIDAEGKPGQAGRVLGGEQHFAYPCVFEWEGEFFMLPDRSKDRRLELYRATSFPHRWRLEQVLMEGLAPVDPTVFEHDGKLWLFGCLDLEPVGPLKSELSLFSAQTPFGPWTPHPGNPVVTDVRRARPAGRVFRRGSDLIRPGQDNARRYGGGVTLSRIDVIDAEEYREVPIAHIGPEQLPGSCGLHTFNADSAYEAVDFCRARPRVPLPRRRRQAVAQ
jgi:hypothetical protein